MAAGIRTLAVALAVLGGCLALPATAPAAAAPAAGTIRLTVVADSAAMSAMAPAEPVAWDVEVSTDVTDPGTVTATLTAATNAAGQFTREVLMCTQAWTSTGCPGTQTVLRATAPVVADSGQTLVSFQAPADRWFRVLVEVSPAAPSGATATFTLRADGIGDSASVTTTGGNGALAATGAEGGLPMLLALGAVALGLLLAGLARRRRDEQPTGGDR